MREIKFRTWDKIGNCWVQDHLLQDFVSVGVPESEKDSGILNLIGISPRVELMQYTGLKDKNGKEIFEGDIVVKDGYLWFNDGKPNYRSTVEWIYSQWQAVHHCINPDKRGISDGINIGLNDDGFEENTNSDWEVIGNIYENPELLAAPPRPRTA